MSTITLIQNNINKPCTTPNKTILNDHIYNLIQYFYIIGIDPNLPFNESFYDIYSQSTSISNQNESSSQLKTFTPKVISKYPNIDLPYLSIPNDIIASHAFPNGISPITTDSSKINQNFIFSFTTQNPTSHSTTHCKTSHIYFTCFLFYEKLSTYLSFYHSKYPSIPVPSLPSTPIYIPKVISVCSYLPLHYSFYKILHMLRDYIKDSTFLTFPLEKVIEHVVFSIPTPPRGLTSIHYAYAPNKEMLIEMPSYNEIPNPDNDLLTVINHMSIDQIFQIIKCLLLEIPVIVFCKDTFVLSNIVEALPSLIIPIEYTFPVIAIMPRMNFVLIQTLSAFIIGINDEYYEGYFDDNKIELGNNNIVILHINTSLHISDIIYHKISTNQPLVSLFNNPNFEYVPPKDIFHINLPLHYTQKTSNAIKAMLLEQKSKNENLSKTQFNLSLRKHFYNYFVSILLYYQEHVINTSMVQCDLYSRYRKCELSISDLINVKEFIGILPKLDRTFYKLFFETTLFFNFIAKKVFTFNYHDKLDVILFDEHINIKLNKKITHQFKRKPTPFITNSAFLKTKSIHIQNPLTHPQLKTQSFTQDEISFISSKTGTSRLVNYFQTITPTPNQMLSITYTMFPKLLNDGVYFNKLYSPSNNTSTYISIMYENSLIHTYNTLQYICNDFIKNNSQLISNYKSVGYSLEMTNGVDMEIKLYVILLWKKSALRFVNVLTPYERSKLFKEFKKVVMLPSQYYDVGLNSYLFMKVLKYGNTELAKLFYIQSKGKTYLKCLSLREKIKMNYSKELRESNYMNGGIRNGCGSMDTSMNNAFLRSSCDGSNINGEVLFESVIKCKKCESEIDIGKEEFVKRFKMVNKNMKEMSFICEHCDQYNVVKINCVIKREECDNYEKICFSLLSCVYLFEYDWLDENDKSNRKLLMEKYIDCFWSTVFYFAVFNLPYKFMFPSNKHNTNIPYEIQPQTQSINLTAIRNSEISICSILK